jgi:hypothetical protein
VKEDEISKECSMHGDKLRGHMAFIEKTRKKKFTGKTEILV